MNLPTELKELNITEEDLLSVALSAATLEQIELLDLAMTRYPDVTELALKEAREEYERLIPDLDEALNKAARKREVMTELTEWIVSPAPMQPASGQSIVGRMKDFALKHFTLQEKVPQFQGGDTKLTLSDQEPSAEEGRTRCHLIIPEGYEGCTIEAELGRVYMALELRLPEPTEAAFDVWITTGKESLQLTGLTTEDGEKNLLDLGQIEYEKIPTKPAFSAADEIDSDFAGSQKDSQGIEPFSNEVNAETLSSVFSRLTEEPDWTIRVKLAQYLAKHSAHGSRDQLGRLFLLLESEPQGAVREALAQVVGSWRAHGDAAHLDRLIYRLESEEDPDVRGSLALAVGSWSVHGDSVLLGGLVSRLESEEDRYLRGSIAEAIGNWSIHGDTVVLERLFSLLESEENWSLRQSLAEAIGCWSVHGDSGLLDRLISRLESEEDRVVRGSLAEAIGAWSIHGDAATLQRLVASLPSESDREVLTVLNSVVNRWSGVNPETSQASSKAGDEFEIYSMEDLQARFAELNVLALILILPSDI